MRCVRQSGLLVVVLRWRVASLHECWDVFEGGWGSVCAPLPTRATVAHRCKGSGVLNPCSCTRNALSFHAVRVVSLEGWWVRVVIALHELHESPFVPMSFSPPSAVLLGGLTQHCKTGGTGLCLRC